MEAPSPRGEGSWGYTSECPLRCRRERERDGVRPSPPPPPPPRPTPSGPGKEVEGEGSLPFQPSAVAAAVTPPRAGARRRRPNWPPRCCNPGRGKEEDGEGKPSQQRPRSTHTSARLPSSCSSPLFTPPLPSSLPFGPIPPLCLLPRPPSQRLTRHAEVSGVPLPQPTSGPPG